MERLNIKADLLYKQLKSYGKLTIAFSGGVDSSTLLAASIRALGKENVLPIICSSAFSIKNVENIARDVAKALNIELHIVNIDVLEHEDIVSNGEDRCYHCKRLIFSTLQTYAQDFGFSVLADGSNFDDDDAKRPGAKAATELGVVSPLKDVGLTKEDIRAFAHELGLENSNLPSNSCLATRVKTGEILTHKVLKMIAQSEEEILQSFDFARLRVKYLVDRVVIEVSNRDSEQLHENADMIIEIVKSIFEDVLVEIAAV